MKKFQFIILFCFGAMLASGQNEFLLYSFKGNVSVVENNVESKAKAGKPLSNTSTVKIGTGGTATLICNESAMFTITKAGTYQLGKFGDSCKVSSNSVSANYVKYVWAQMTKSSGSPGSNRKAYMNTVGAVSRGGISNVWVDPILDTVNYSGGDFPLSWKSYVDAKEFDFFLYKLDNLTEAFYTKTVAKLKIPIASFLSQLKPGQSYRWIAAIKGETPSEEMQVLNYVSKESFAALLENIKKQAAIPESPAEEAYRIAFMLEDGHYLSEAHQYYTKAANLDPTNPLYRSTLMSFRKDYEIK
jgi:hypothetical protein